ncbi:MAG: aspartate carbamoyltransferase [Bacteroidales bacterium]|jgi:aspartate carbamoyltransferase catalytic subunit|nr:aspartate carbamoyltransferase [Bacteroidales bacterium]
MKGKSLVSILDYQVEEYLQIIQLASEFEALKHQNILHGKVVGSLFFEPSTRTRLSFESAVNHSGGRIIGFSDSNTSSSTKGESLKDTILTVANYCDLIVMRHPHDGAAKFASEISPVPIINAGDGANQHPTQTLLDMYSIYKTQGKLDNLTISLIGDLKYGRTVHSLLMAMMNFSPKFNLVSPKELCLPVEYKKILNAHSVPFNEDTDLHTILPETDILYMTRVQKERFSDPIEYEKNKNLYVLKSSMLENTKDNMKILHPLPRVNEISQCVDSSPKAYYFQQAKNGMFTRQAIISSILGLI